MDSDNSGSLQYSSGGDEEYDSRAAAEDSIPAFMSIHPTVTPLHVGLVPSPTLFDPISGYPDPYPPPLLDPGISWSRFDPISAPFMPSPFQADNFLDAASLPVLPAAARNPKKRSRASRRAPTTVLTTDTTNFRTMVQEFTGIPASPFGGPLSRNRLGLSALPPSYLRRSFPQKVHSPPFPGSAPLLTDPSSVQLPFPQSSNLFNISNQCDAKFPFSGSFLQSIKPPGTPSDEFGAGLGDVSHHENLVSLNRNDWTKALSPVEGNDHQDQVALINGNSGSFPGNQNMNYSDSSSKNLQTEVKPWICSSE